jgi:hypothetical protein
MKFLCRLGYALLLAFPWAVFARQRFDPPFQNELHRPRAEDAQIVQILKDYRDGEFGKPRLLGLVHGHFLGDGKETAVVAAFWRLQTGFSPVTFLFSRGAGGWRIEFRDTSETVAYCRVIPAGASKDMLLCQSDFVGPTGRYGRGKVDTNLYSVDFTQPSPISYFLRLEDTVATASRCLSWANVKSVEYHTTSVRVLVEYGRKQLPQDERVREEFKKRAMRSQGSPHGFTSRVFNLEFSIGEAGLALADGSKADYDYVTARWSKDQGIACPAPNQP